MSRAASVFPLFAQVGKSWGWIGSLAGGWTLITAMRQLIVDILGWKMNVSLQGFIDYYRGVTSYLFAWAPALFNLTVPQWYVDLFLLNALLATALLRGGLDRKAEVTAHGTAFRFHSRYAYGLWSVLLSVPLLASVAFIWLPLARMVRHGRQIEERHRALAQARANGPSVATHGFDAYDRFIEDLRFEEARQRSWNAQDRKAIGDAARVYVYLALSVAVAFIFYVWAIYSA